MLIYENWILIKPKEDSVCVNESHATDFNVRTSSVSMNHMVAK